MSDPEFLTVTKFDAARRQLRTAIELWFNDGDPVSIHVLAFSAYEIIHTLSRRKGAKNLLYDSSFIKEESRKKFNIALKRPASFFKHAQTDPDGTLEFSPAQAEGLVTFCIIALQDSGESLCDEELAFANWDTIHSPERLTEEGRKFLIKSLPVDQFREIRNIAKGDFLKTFLEARRIARASGDIR